MPRAGRYLESVAVPELPEVETTRRGVSPLVTGRRVSAVVVRESRLRWPVPRALPERLTGRQVSAVERRAKYLLLRCGAGTVLIHLGMSGSLRVVPAATPATPHDHVDIVLDDGQALRLRDPRRFGAVLWLTDDPSKHPLLAALGPEPLGDGFDGAYLHRHSRGRRASVKAFVMDSRVVVGVGNIYAAEGLFRAGIHPRRAAGRISAGRYHTLAVALRTVLSEAIDQGGTTLRDFVAEDGRPGYFRQRLNVYGRQGEPCLACATPLAGCRIAQRSTVYCPNCQR